MTASIQTEMEKVRATMAGLEAQRAILGDTIVDSALAALRQQLVALEAQAAAQAAPPEERRPVSILFADIVGSTTLAEKLDPEEWRQTAATVLVTLGDIIGAHHGTVDKYLGDGVLALFGAHEASEQDPENAVRAALEFQTAIAKLEVGQQIQVRTGIHTGLVVLGELGAEAHKEYTAIGDAMNLAARLQSAAPPGGVLISHDTYRHVRGVFDVTPRPPLTVKGKVEPIQTYLVRRAKPRPFRTVTRGVAGVEARTVGRQAELQRLQAAYQDAYEHRGVVWAQLIGEAGVGKSRLLEDMTNWLELREETCRLLRARAFSDDGGQPFALVRRMWFDRFRIAEDAPLAQAETRWVREFQELAGREDIEPAHALGLLVGLPFEGSPYIGAMRDDPSQVRGRAFVVSRQLLQAIRAEYPLVILLEDMHWADAASWDYLTEVILGNAGNGAPNGLFVLAAARPDWSPPGALCSAVGYVPISLAPLSGEASRELIQELMCNVEGTPEDVIELMVEQSEGVPYFAEEMVNWLIDRGVIDRSSEPWRFVAARLKESPLPATLQHLLLTRLGALSDAERAALQRGAIFGRRFWTGGVEALAAQQGGRCWNGCSRAGLCSCSLSRRWRGRRSGAFPRRCCAR